MGTLTWKYSKPDDNLWDWNMSLYGNRYRQRPDQDRAPQRDAIGLLRRRLGNTFRAAWRKRSYVLDTLGSTSTIRRDSMSGDWRNAVTLGLMRSRMT